MKRLTIASAIIAFLLIMTILQVFMLIRLNKRHRELNRKLGEQRKELEELNDQKDTFFSFVAHNLKNPFNAILGFSELISKKIESGEHEKLSRYAGHIQSLSVHVYRILENLLEWSRLQRRSFEYKPERLEINNLIHDVIEMNAKEASRKQIQLSCELPVELYAHADKFMVTIILQNLISNALNFTPSSGKIMVSGFVNGPRVKISVSDTGIGIAPEDLPKLFRIDVQPAKIGTAESKGAGLGLVICREMVQRCGGDITVDSQLSRGTVFSFTLPVPNEDNNPAGYESTSQKDYEMILKNDLKKLGTLPEEFVDTCRSSLLLKYKELGLVLSLDDLLLFAGGIEAAGEKYKVTAFIQYGNDLSAMGKSCQIDKIVHMLPEFKKMTDIFLT